MLKKLWAISRWRNTTKYVHKVWETEYSSTGDNLYVQLSLIANQNEWSAIIDEMKSTFGHDDYVCNKTRPCFWVRGPMLQSGFVEAQVDF
jgi:hypothetical protein